MLSCEAFKKFVYSSVVISITSLDSAKLLLEAETILKIANMSRAMINIVNITKHTFQIFLPFILKLQINIRFTPYRLHLPSLCMAKDKCNITLLY